MSQVQEKYQEAESSYDSDLLNLVVAKGYLTKLLSNEAVNSYIQRHEPEILEHALRVVAQFGRVVLRLSPCPAEAGGVNSTCK